MEIELDLTKSLEENAGRYFELAKKAKKKMLGAQRAVEESKKKLQLLEREQQQFTDKEAERQRKPQHTREWYEKFHWFFSSEGFLCIGGKDATSNELVIKKHTDQADLVFHTDMAGSPFFVVKNGQQAGEITRLEAAQATAAYSRAWKLGHTTTDVFFVKPEQVSKEAKPGEYLSRGSFMIYGKTQYVYPRMEYAIGIVEGRIIGGPETAVKAKTDTSLLIIPGDEKKSDLAKKIKAKLKGGELDDIIAFLPAGGGKIK